MTPRWLAHLTLVAALGLATSPALAQSGKVKKAEKMLVKYDGADQVALAKAWDSIQKAKVHAKTRDDALTWVVLGEVVKAYALDPDAESPVPNAGLASAQAFDTAVGKDADKAHAERILESVGLLESTLSSRANEAFESKQYDEAWASLEAVLLFQKVTRQIGRVDAAREMSALQLAVLTSVKRNELDTALSLHAELAEAYKAPSATSLAVAAAVAEEKGTEEALAFVAPLSDKNPDDAPLLQARFEYLFALEQTDTIVELLTQNADSLGKALAISLLHAKTWDRVEDLAKAAEAYARSMEVDPQDQRVLRGYADVELRRAAAFDVAASATRKWRERRDLRNQRDEARQRAMSLLQESRRVTPDHLPTLELLREVYRDVRLRDREEINALEQAIEDLKAAQEAPEETD